jgi:hypothetical protein
MKILFYASEYAPEEEIHIIVSPQMRGRAKDVCIALQKLIDEIKEEPEE